jgi:hypothetical protein
MRQDPSQGTNFQHIRAVGVTVSNKIIGLASTEADALAGL